MTSPFKRKRPTIYSIYSVITKAILPPVVTEVIRKLRRSFSKRPSEEDLLFDGHGALFRQLVADARVYGEYGCGRSTIWVLRNTEANVISAETDEAWMQKVAEEVGSTDRLHSHVIDVGPIGAWGRPMGYGKRENFRAYAEAIWSHDTKPDTVLIDGRFRILTFATCLQRADSGARLLFDDYNKRALYHVVEEVLKPTKVTDRQALFVVPARRELDIPKIRDMADKFEFVLT